MSRTVRAERISLISGMLWGSAAVAIWAGWWVMTRMSVTASLQGADLAALRFGISGTLMLPVAARSRTALFKAPPHLLFFMAFP